MDNSSVQYVTNTSSLLCLTCRLKTHWTLDFILLKVETFFSKLEQNNLPSVRPPLHFSLLCFITHLGCLGTDSFFGEASFFDDKETSPPSAEISAVGNCVVRFIPQRFVNIIFLHKMMYSRDGAFPSKFFINLGILIMSKYDARKQRILEKKAGLLERAASSGDKA